MNSVLQLVRIVAVLALVTAGVNADIEHLARKVINADGWEIPGRQWVQRHRKAASETFLILGDRRVTLRLFGNIEDSLSEAAGGRFSLIFQSPNYLRVRDLNLKAQRIEEYSIEGRVFCYYVSVAPYTRPSQGPGGVSAITFLLAFYDDDGDGSFETLEAPDPILRTGESAIKIRLPKWITDKPLGF